MHSLSGWKLQALLGAEHFPPAAPFDENFVRTNFVAGYVLPDGRSVVTGLPRAEAEMLNLSATFPDFKLPAPGGDASLKLVRADGRQFKATFVGFDAGTGLSLLEAEQPLMPPAAESKLSAPTPAVGQRVRLIAPIPPPVPTGAAASAQKQPSRDPEFWAAGTRVVLLNLGEAEGRIREVKRSPSGRPAAFGVQGARLSPEWTGGVALSETGEFVGIVERSGEPETRLISAEAVRGAAARVLARRASVPQPWLGARGDAATHANLDLFMSRGWPREEARALVEKQLGVLLTSVAPGTPAALAGLRPGDVVARIGPHQVRSVEDMSLMLRELGGNSVASFTVLRAQSSPVDLQIRLSESHDPALETARAEGQAAQAEVRRAEDEARLVYSNIALFEGELLRSQEQRRRLDGVLREAQTPARAAEVRRRLKEVEQALEEHRRLVVASRARLNTLKEREAELRRRLLEAEARARAAGAGHAGLGVKALAPFGLEAVAAPPAVLKRFGAREGWLVVGVRPSSPAREAGIKIGDVIEAVNGRAVTGADRLMPPGDGQSGLTLGLSREGKKLSIKLAPPGPAP